MAILAKIALFYIFSAKNLDLSVNFAFLQKTCFSAQKTHNYEEVFTYPYSRDFLLAERGFCATIWHTWLLWRTYQFKGEHSREHLVGGEIWWSTHSVRLGQTKSAQKP
ncbi:MAG: hypothetical protein II210_03325 [Rikenellaceae bacterium]|nr:hypothetical protein [Rikenellaceae bacterium]